MKYTWVILIGLFCGITIASGCKTQSKTTAKAAASTATEQEAKTEPVSNIALYDKPLAVVKANVVGQKWQLVYSIGGITGRDRNSFESTYYTLTKDGNMIVEKDGAISEHPYEWEEQRDIYTGDTINIVSGIVQWKINGIDNDTLRILDNYVDGYSYSFIRGK